VIELKEGQQGGHVREEGIFCGIFVHVVTSINANRFFRKMRQIALFY
jgi:hypothetical protein